jgi:hypothetical protein
VFRSASGPQYDSAELLQEAFTASTASCFALGTMPPASNDPAAGVFSIDQFHHMPRVVGKRQPADPHLNQSHQAEKVLRAARALKFLPLYQGSLKRPYQSALLERFGQKRHCAGIERT